MARINSNVPSLVAQANLRRANADLEIRLNRLATGLRINRGADDPAGLIVSERLRSDIRGAEQGIKNAERASSVIATTEAAIAEVNDLLNSIKALVVEAANTGAFSDEELEANQLQINSAIDSITRISNTATFGGLRLLNGELDYTLSGVDSAAISRAKVHGASFVGESQLQVEVDVLASAQVGAVYVPGDQPFPGSPLNGTLLSSLSLQISGNRGITELSFLSGASLADVVTAINKLTSVTGVTASLINGDATSGIVFKSEGYGTDSFVSVKRLDSPPSGTASSWETWVLDNNAAVPDPFDWNNTALVQADHDRGRDVMALVNGNLATGDGLKVKVNSQTLSVDLLLAEAFATDPTATNSTFNITGGGALFQLGGEITATQQANIGVGSVAASRLGGVLRNGQLHFLSSLKSGGVNSLRASKQAGDFSTASDVLEAAIDEVSVLRGRLGAFERNVLQPNVRSLQTAVENLSASDSSIRDADFAYETSRLTRSQILTQTATSVLALANQQSQQVLQLLG